MNTLSWFLYLAELVNSIGNVAVFVAMIGIGGFGTLWLLHGLSIGDSDEISPPSKWWLVIGAISVAVAVVLPNAKTLQMIAASELGGRVVQSQQMQGIVDPGLQYVEQWLRQQIDPKPAKKE